MFVKVPILQSSKILKKKLTNINSQVLWSGILVRLAIPVRFRLMQLYCFFLENCTYNFVENRIESESCPGHLKHQHCTTGDVQQTVKTCY